MQVFHPSSHWLRGKQVARKPTTHLQTVCVSSNWCSHMDDEAGIKARTFCEAAELTRLFSRGVTSNKTLRTKLSDTSKCINYKKIHKMQRYHVVDVSPDWFLCLHAWGGGGSRDVMTSDKWHGEGLTFRKLILNWNSVSHGAQTFTEGWSLTSCPSALTSLSQRTKRLATRDFGLVLPSVPLNSFCCPHGKQLKTFILGRLACLLNMIQRS